MFVQKIIIEIDDRRENAEDFISDNILKRWDEYKNADDLREAGSLALINAVATYASTYGLPALSDDVKKQLAKENAKVLKRLNNKLQEQLKKKNKNYEKNNSLVNGGCLCNSCRANASSPMDFGD